MRTSVTSWSLVLAVVGLAASLCVSPVCAQETPAQKAASDSSTYVVEDGDTLYGIAREAGVSVRTLMAWNDLDDTSVVPGQTLRIRPPGANAPAREDSSPEPSGETPEDGGAQEEGAQNGNAQNEDAQNEDAQNEDARDEASQDTSRDAEPPDVEPSTPPPLGRYEVEPGDTFASVALRAGLLADSLVALNDSLARRVGVDSLPPGDVLRLPRRFGPPTHVVQRGETLYAIAGEYGVSVRSLQRVNALSSTTLSPGQRLRVPGTTPPVPDTLAAPDTTGPVTVYPSTFAGRLTASGQAYNPDALVGSHPSLPYGAVVHLTNPATGQSVRVRIIDRGPVEDALLMDVSRAVANALGLPGDGNAPVELRVVWGTPPSDLFSSQP